jgi:hypothetical protein
MHVGNSADGLLRGTTHVLRTSVAGDRGGDPMTGAEFPLGCEVLADGRPYPRRVVAVETVAGVTRYWTKPRDWEAPARMHWGAELTPVPEPVVLGPVLGVKEVGG